MTASGDFPDAAALQRIADALWTTSGGTRASVMVGAGFSKLARRVSADVPEPPLWSDFSHEMTKSLYPTADPNSILQDPLRLAQEYFAVHGGSGVDALIRRLIRDNDWQPSDAHERLVSLPWANILTTNWDTLLERAAIRSVTSSYDIVRSVTDIPHTVGPRIIKLHGSLPSNTPFIFTEEDYRRYPRDFAPFMNLAQHVMMESVCCLVGFSGTDPNFLQWSGWVRDNLGRNAPTIYLVGALSISSSQRRMLEARNVYPVDLSPLIGTADRNQQHSDAIRLFLELLKKSEPRAAYLWPHVSSLPPALNAFQKLDDKSDAAHERQIAVEALPALSALRAAYPGWVVAASNVRALIGHRVLPWRAVSAQAFIQMPRSGQHRLIYELTWLHSIALLPPTNQLHKWIVELLDGDVEPELSANEVDELALYLVQTARQQLDHSQYEKWLRYLGKRQGKSQEMNAGILYEQCLFARDLMQYDKLEELADRLEGDDPMWMVRRAYLLSELGAVSKARRSLQEAVQDLRLRRSSGARSIWLDSRFAWLSLLASAIRPPPIKGGPEVEAEFLEDEKWRARYAQIKSDPWAELRSTIDQLRGRRERLEELKPTAKSLFDAGRYRPSQKTITFGRAFDADISFVGRRVVDTAGTPNALDHIGFPAHTIRTQCTELDTTGEPMALLRAFSIIGNHKDPLLEKLLNRISVAQLTEACAESISDALFKAIKFGRSRLQGGGAEYDAMFWTERVRTLLEIASRISVRLSAPTARHWFEFAMEFAESPECSQWWLFEALGNLIARSLEPLASNERRSLTFGIFKFPLASERKVLGLGREWPEPSRYLDKTEIDRSENEEGWSIRVQQLIFAVRQADADSRTNAALRLMALRDRKALSDDEADQLSAALWARTDEKTGMPIDVNLLPHVFIELDRTKAPIVEAAVRSKWLTLPMDKLSREAVEELLGLTSVFGRSLPALVLTESEAAALISVIVKQTVKWSTDNAEDKPFERHPTNDRYLKTSSGYLVADGALPAIATGNGNGEVFEALLWAIEAAEAAHLVLSLPELMRVSPHFRERAMSALQRAIKSSDEILVRGAYEAVLRWINRLDRPDIPPFPHWLAHVIAIHISLRRRPGLYEALLCGFKLMEKERLEVADIALVIEGLSFLVSETNYDRFAGDDNSARSITLERQLCVKIARHLIANGQQAQSLQQWVAVANADPLPEVRLAAT